MRILDILKARKLGYQTLHNTTDMLLAKKVSGGSYEDVTVSGNPISITGAKGGLVKALTVDMLPIQAGNGTPSPDNIRPISGRSSLDVTVNGNTETINFGETVYGGTCDVVNGGNE